MLLISSNKILWLINLLFLYFSSNWKVGIRNYKSGIKLLFLPFTELIDQKGKLERSVDLNIIYSNKTHRILGLLMRFGSKHQTPKSKQGKF